MALFDATRSITLNLAAACEQYRFVEMNGANIQRVNANGDDAVGVSLEARVAADITAGDTGIAVALLDGAKMPITLGATVAAGAAVMSNTTGQAITATATNVILGYALEGGAVGDIVTLLGTKGGGVV